MTQVSAAPYLALLGDEDPNLKGYALTSLNEVVAQLWAEIANKVTDLEELYEDENFEKRRLAALVISKVYYNLGDYEASVKYSLYAGDEFNLEEQTQYVETIISQCINLYSSKSRNKFTDPLVEIDLHLSEIFERMVEKCIKSNELKLALGISLESYRIDLLENILKQKRNSEENVLSLANYVLICTNTTVSSSVFRDLVLKLLINVLLSLEVHQDYFTVFKIIVQLNDWELASVLFKKLLNNGDNLIAYQAAFDLVNTATQELLDNVIDGLREESSGEAWEQSKSRLLNILGGIPTSDLNLTFLYKKSNIDISILNKTKNLLEGRSSIFHSGITFANAFIHAGTTDDSFFRKNLEWLGKATNWSKFSATAALGVIHKGNLSQGRNILKPYLPSSSGASYTKGGSLFALGLIFAGHGKEAIEYLKKFIDEHGNAAGNVDNEVMLHGACLGSGVAGMGSNNEDLYESVKVVLYSDSAVSGQAAGIAMGLLKLGSGDDSVINDMFTYARDTQHETIVRGLALGIALVNYGKNEEADIVIDQLMAQESSILRYGGAFAIALAYAGTANNGAIKKLLHIAVSDPSDNVRRASVVGLGFLLIRDYTSAPQIVELLSQSHNPHIRYGTAIALGISCAGKGLDSALEILEPLIKDPVDFVRLGALIASAMILIQQNESVNPKIKDFVTAYASTIENKHEDALAKFGATIAQGIIDAGGRNVTISLEHAQTNTLNTKAIVGLALFLQSWFWFPLAHFLSLSLVPISIIGIREDLKAPKFDLNCHTNPEAFQYPPKVEDSKQKQLGKLATAVLSTTAKAKARAKKNHDLKNKGESDDEMDIDESNTQVSVKDQKDESHLTKDNENPVVVRYTKSAYKIPNMSRVVPAQSNYISFDNDGRFSPVRKLNNDCGVILLRDSTPDESIELIKTVRQMNITEAPLPEPFILSGEDLKFDEE